MGGSMKVQASIGTYGSSRRTRYTSSNGAPWSARIFAPMKPGYRSSVKLRITGNASSNVRVISTIVDPSGSPVAKDVSASATIMASRSTRLHPEHRCQQARVVVARRTQPLQAPHRSAGRRQSGRSLRNASSASDPSSSTPRQGFLLNGAARQAEGHLQPPGPCRNRRRITRCSAVLSRPQTAGDGLQLASHLAQPAHA